MVRLSQKNKKKNIKKKTKKRQKRKSKNKKPKKRKKSERVTNHSLQQHKTGGGGGLYATVDTQPLDNRPQVL